MHHEILTTLAVGLTAALVFGYITYLLRLSPIVGYLVAGFMVGQNAPIAIPGFQADQGTANQFAELGVILLMFGVGLHFDLRDLMAVRRIALPGAVGQITAATLLAMVAVHFAGWGWMAGLMVGMAASVASTVVLIRVLSDNNVLETEQGHIAVGWLIVEDLFTVFVLVLLPAIAQATQSDDGGIGPMLAAFGIATVKVVVLSVIVLWGGRKVIPRLLERVARTRMRELFTLTILAVAMAIATGSAALFDVSMALGAFMAGMVVGQSEVSHQAAADALPMRDAFAVLFFVSVGMLFDPGAMISSPVLFTALLGVILIAKPLAALGIVWFLGGSIRTGLTVAVALAQIGEFSFILADAAFKLNLLPETGNSLLVACSIVSIAINPLFFLLVEPMERWLKRRPKLWKVLTQRSESRAKRLPDQLNLAGSHSPDRPRAIIVGYGPVGRTATTILKDFGVEPVIVDLNVDTVTNIAAAGGLAVYGDASHREIQEAAGIHNAKYLLITIPDLATRTVIILIARELNPDIKVFVRARYIQERAWLDEIGATEVVYEEAEAAIELAGILLRERGADEEQIREEQHKIRSQWAIHGDLEISDLLGGQSKAETAQDDPLPT